MQKTLSFSRFYIPTLYFFLTHSRTLARQASWFLIYLLPLALFVYLSGAQAVLDQLLMLFAVVITYNYYDIGYIYNDTETIRKEQNPTMRLDAVCLEHYYSHKAPIYFVRHLFGLAGLFVAFKLAGPAHAVQFGTFGAAMACMTVAYYIYNNVRNVLNLVISPILTFFRHAAPLFLVLPVENYGLIAQAAIVVFVIPNFLCWLAKPRFRLFSIQGVLENYDKTRACYFIFATLFFVMIGSTGQPLMSLLEYFLCLRMVYLLVSFNKAFNDRYLRSVRN
jgi:hypothetical protein